MRARTRPRPAYTLIELIIVIGIIALLASLTLSAVFRMQESRRETNTNTHLNKIHMELEKQWKAKVTAISKENVPDVVYEITKNADGTRDNARARALHMKLRLRQEFPQHFGEVFAKVTLTVGSYTYIYDGKPIFKKAAGNPLQDAQGRYLEIPEAQSAAILVLILSQGAGGSTTDVDTIARTKLMDYPQQGGGNITLKVFSDEWGNHMAFRRVADDDMTDVLTDLNQPPFVAALPSPNPPTKADPQDPEGRLSLPANQWITTNGQNGKVLATSFLAGTDPSTRPYLVDPFKGWNRGPFVVSSGKNGVFYQPNGAWEVDLDNLYSYRVGSSGRGN
jgi:prepilin-type N-terminal cleavage/methylation domain-containing protein